MKPRPIYRTDGEWVALLRGGHLFDALGEWVGWLEGNEVYSRDGEYVGYISEDGRLLRPRIRPDKPRRDPPSPPPRIPIPDPIPLPPMFAELPFHIIDVFEEEPHLFNYISELRPDWED